MIIRFSNYSEFNDDAFRSQKEALERCGLNRVSPDLSMVTRFLKTNYNNNIINLMLDNSNKFKPDIINEKNVL